MSESSKKRRLRKELKAKGLGKQQRRAALRALYEQETKERLELERQKREAAERRRQVVIEQHRRERGEEEK
jgi:hypothetical protein